MGLLSPLTIGLCAVFFVVLGATWITGYNVVRRLSPRNLPRLYLLLAIVRIVAMLTVAGIYIVFVSRSLAESKAFAVMALVMYATMMAFTLKIRH